MTAAAIKLAFKGVWKLFGPDPAGILARHARSPGCNEAIGPASGELA